MALLLLVVAVAACSSSSSSASKDVTVTACTASPGGGKPSASGTVTNYTSKDSAYLIRVTFADASGNGVGEAVATLAKVAAH